MDLFNVNVGGVQFIDAGLGFFELQFNGTLSTLSAVQLRAYFFQFTIQTGQTTLSNTVLIQGGLQLTLNVFVVGLQFGQLQGLFLDNLLQINVGLVGNIQGHFQFGDLDLQLLLNALDFGLQAGFGFNNASVQLFDFDGILCPFLFDLRSSYLKTGKGAQIGSVFDVDISGTWSSGGGSIRSLSRNSKMLNCIRT
ncbi:hypothetical protein FF38_04698 [Lucilia cuprina]|uniref:Uncharacterized protein n=1 Tax=Lucilia cuprina TaxID=7375 RepID=A0A0L0CLH4_LUCCU|nr:hypothetical protein FF38_04698 [Lucilia cuprina]